MRRKWLAICALIWLAAPRAARAGMPSLSLSDTASLRLQTISFFLLGLLIAAGVIWWIWNAMRKDFVRLPRLSYPKACGLVVLWGLLFVVVLTMIAGARELMTPGAWEKKGLTYKLREADSATTPVEQTSYTDRRRAQFTRLAERLRQFADAHNHRFPTAEQASEIPDSFWRLDDPSGLRYIYVPGQSESDGAAPVAYEPQLAGEPLFVLSADGVIQQLGFDDIVRRRPRAKAP